MKNDLKISADIFKSADLKLLAKPLLALLGILIMIFVVLSYGTKELSKIQSQITVKERDKKILTGKIQLLNKISGDELLSGDIASFALPNENAVIYAISQVRNLAAIEGLSISNIRSGGSFEEKNVSRLTLSFEIAGNNEAIYRFLESVTKMLPIMTVQGVKINTEGSQLSAAVSVHVYSAELPKKIPPVSSAITDLTEEQSELLMEISTYRKPEFFEVSAQEHGHRDDPFN